ncbi:sulfotransferase family 2 domain-containing protein [Alkalilacustris brevis]|uniref:sulfotransferase family 2 domain-containing protein n=1 Tax=Alkalilacustris brevis TaxID=2026338 RepID=UPI000E0D0A23|nr:sulfotransferase family 2 domain-containing protein [Alkalilacustris brevis]
MPIIKSARQLIYFAHVPKCGGASLTRYLSRRFGPLAFADERHLIRPSEGRATVVSPQHLTREQLDRLFPARFFDATFAVIRHPVSRIVSEYHYDSKLRELDPSPPFGDWLQEALDLAQHNPGARDNHLRCQVEFLPGSDTALFRIEDGMTKVVEWLNTVTASRSFRAKVPHCNAAETPAARSARQLVGPADLERIVEHYAADFERLGYERAHPDVIEPSLGAVGDRQTALQGTLCRIRRRFSQRCFW